MLTQRIVITLLALAVLTLWLYQLGSAVKDSDQDSRIAEHDERLKNLEKRCG